jgi:hypothetical protein
MSRQLTTERATPHFDRWLARLTATLEAPGARAELVRTLAQGDARQSRRWQVTLWKVFNQKMMPDGENLLAITAWMDAQRRA